MTMKIGMGSALAAGLVAASASTSAASYWSTVGYSATTSFDSGVEVAVMFLPDFGCHEAIFAVLGNSKIGAMRFTIDGRPFNLISPESGVASGVPYTGFVLSSAGLRSLKKGMRLYLETDEGNLSVSLAGSASAFNRAWRHCEAIAN